jgi:hypothetical protein
MPVHHHMLATLAMLAASAPAAMAQAPKVGDIRVHLFYERSGTLSEDITKSKPALFNIIIASGDELKEPANSFIAAVAITGKPSGFDDSDPVIVTVTDEKTRKKIVERRFNAFLFDDKGRVVKPVFVEDKVCAPVRIVARNKAGTKSVVIPFRCGE